MNPDVDAFIRKAGKWQNETGKLRRLLLGCGLTEELKWSKPCYSHNGHNIVIIQGFKEYFAIMFFKGVLLSDPAGILVSPGQNSQSGRQVRFTDVRQIDKMEALLKAYIFEAVEVEEAGLKVILKRMVEYSIPEELQSKFIEMPALKTAFDTLTPGRQRAYILYFSAPKKPETRVSRIEKHIARILDGKGLND